MRLSDAFLSLGEEPFGALLRSISIGKLKTYQMYEGLKVRLHLNKLNAETIRKAAPRLWTRLNERDEEFAQDLAQAILVSHIGMIRAVLDFLGIPNEEGFFAKDVDATPYLTEGWQERVYEKFKDDFPRPLLLFYVNHLAWELARESHIFAPAA
ncbi:MAG TPA: hypothetical protein VFQ79_05475 [Bryobacteraceae bacterium]|nr:hypothetical protein [Bryobacteraceae bacterium]